MTSKKKVYNLNRVAHSQSPKWCHFRKSVVSTNYDNRATPYTIKKNKYLEYKYSKNNIFKELLIKTERFKLNL